MKTLFGIFIFGPMVALLLFVLARFMFCGPDKSVEKVAFPLAKSIVGHIEKNGVPKSLSDVEGLPYALKCGNPNIRENIKIDLITKKSYVSYRETTQSCSFSNKKRHYGVSLRVGEADRGEYDDIYISKSTF